MTDNINYIDTSFPPAAEYFLKRPDVENLLIDAFKKPLTTVIAEAGYGKTQVVLSALKSSDYKSVWVQLSELDNHVTRFWECIANSLEPYSNNLFNSLTSLGYPESIAAFDQFLRLLSKELALKERYILVFDDFHLIYNKSILKFFELFISSRIKNFSIVLISRTKPKLNLAWMLSKGFLARISSNDLRFSKEEMDKYFHEQGIYFSYKTSSDIYTYTDGWIFAISLVGLAARKGDVSNHDPIVSAKIDIFNLIETEVFGQVSNELQDFLIRISIFDNIPSGLLKELTGSNLHLISEMKQLSMFMRYDPVSDSYWIHHLFKEFLLEQKDRIGNDEIYEINFTAAKWYKKNGRISEALILYKECGCYDEIFDIIFSINYRVPKETADYFIELISQAPDEIIRIRPVMRVVKAKYMFYNNRITEATQELSEILKEYETMSNSNVTHAVLGEAYIILALISIVNQDYKFEELFKLAYECLPEGSRIIDNKINIAEGINVCSIKDPYAGELKRHQNALFDIAPYATRVMNGCGYGIESLNAAESSIYTADLKAAEKYAYEAIYKSRQYQQCDIEYMANFALVRIFTAKGNYEKVSDILNQMETQLHTFQTFQNSICISLYDIINGWFHMKTGHTDKIAKWIRYEEESKNILSPVHLGREYLVRSDCLLAEEKYYELLAYMEQTNKMYESRGILFAVIQNKITKAIIYHYIKNYMESMEALYEAFELSHPNNLIMQFIEYGNKMRTLIHTARLKENCKIPKAWLDSIYTKSSTYAKQLSRVISAYNADNITANTGCTNLSKREFEVLQYLSRGMTRNEIAESCYLSISTISSMIRSIYNKLGASNIADAVRIAKERNFL